MLDTTTTVSQRLYAEILITGISGALGIMGRIIPAMIINFARVMNSVSSILLVSLRKNSFSGTIISTATTTSSVSH